MDQTESEQMKERYEGFMRDVPCPVCEGTRLKPEILAVTLAGGARHHVDRRGLRTVHRRLLRSSSTS